MPRLPRATCRSKQSDDRRVTAEATNRYHGFPDGFFERQDESPDGWFYDQPRIVTHIDDRAIRAVGEVYEQLGIGGRVLDVCSSWISHLTSAPEALICQGMNAPELAANEMATGGVVVDLNRQPLLPFRDHSFDSAVCCVSVDYLTRPLEVFDELARVLRPGGLWVHVFSNRCFPTKAIRGWLSTDDEGHVAIVSEYFRRSLGWEEPQSAVVLQAGRGGDPLYAVWATTRSVQDAP